MNTVLRLAAAAVLLLALWSMDWDGPGMWNPRLAFAVLVGPVLFAAFFGLAGAITALVDGIRALAHLRPLQARSRTILDFMGGASPIVGVLAAFAFWLQWMQAGGIQDVGLAHPRAASLQLILSAPVYGLCAKWVVFDLLSGAVG